MSKFAGTSAAQNIFDGRDIAFGKKRGIQEMDNKGLVINGFIFYGQRLQMIMLGKRFQSLLEPLPHRINLLLNFQLSVPHKLSPQ